MYKKKSMVQEIWDYLSKDIALQRNLQKGLLNVRALAKYIIKEKKLKSSPDAAISAIRRFSHNKSFLTEVMNIKNIFKASNVTTKNNIACVVLRNQSDIRKYLSEISKTTDFEKGEMLRLIKGRNNLKILTGKENAEKLKDLFLDKNIEIKDNLSEIRINTSLKADQTKGVAAKLASELMLKDINISEIIFCVPEIIIYVNQKDLLKAHENIMELCQEN